MRGRVTFLAIVASALAAGCGTAPSAVASAHDAAAVDPNPGNASDAGDSSSRDSASGALDGSGLLADASELDDSGLLADASENGDAGRLANADASTDASAGVSCGSTVCPVGQACMQAAGGPANCSPLGDAGGCPTGFSYRATCPNLANHPGCLNSAPRPLGCVTLPASCTMCSCVPSSTCPMGSTCASVAPGSLLCGSP
jgi:hypothetical protein